MVDDIPVSYTHLDVYKRQLLELCGEVKQQCSIYCKSDISKCTDVETNVDSKYEIDIVRIIVKLADKELNN